MRAIALPLSVCSRSDAVGANTARTAKHEKKSVLKVEGNAIFISRFPALPS